MDKQAHGNSRRDFLKVGAIAAAPFAAIAVPAAATASDGSKARLALLEDRQAIEALHRHFLRRFNADGLAGAEKLVKTGKAAGLGSDIRKLALDLASEPQAPRLAEDGLSASCSHACQIEREHALEGDCTLVQMARLQGNGPARATAAGTLRAEYVKTAEGWTIGSIALV